MAFPGTPVGHLSDRGMNPQPRPPGLRHFGPAFTKYDLLAMAQAEVAER